MAGLDDSRLGLWPGHRLLSAPVAILTGFEFVRVRGPRSGRRVRVRDPGEVGPVARLRVSGRTGGRRVHLMPVGLLVCSSLVLVPLDPGPDPGGACLPALFGLPSLGFGLSLSLSLSGVGVGVGFDLPALSLRSFVASFLSYLE